MQQYKYIVRWIPGNTNIADSLSSLQLHTIRTASNRNADDQYIQFIVEEASPRQIAIKKIECAFDDDA